MKLPNIIRVLVVLAVVLTANLTCAPKPGATKAAQSLPGNRSLRKQYQALIAHGKPQVILLGNSMLGEGVNHKQLSALTGKRCIKYWKGGAASAWWYLSIKNVITKSTYKPEAVVIFFRDSYLTMPGFRVTGDNVPYIKDMSDGDEPLLQRLAYTRKMSKGAYLLHKSMPLYAQKNTIKNKLVTSIKDVSTKILLGLEPGQADTAIRRTFKNKNMNKELLTTRQLAAEQIDEKDTHEFTESLQHSFLPEIIKIAKKSDIKLVFVRIKRLRDLDPKAEPESTKRYVANLKDYLTKNNCPFLDYTYDERIKLEHYAEGDHLSKEIGMGLFTSILAKELPPVLHTQINKSKHE